MMFAKPVVLNRETHRELLFQPAGAYGFAAGLHAAPLCASEFFPAAKEYAIVFARAADGSAFPVIVLGLHQDENCFVSSDGQWHARYVPFAVRSYPFTAVESTDTGSLQVVIDESYPGFDATVGTPLFGDTGDPTPELQEKMQFLQAYQREVIQTRRFAAELGRLGLLIERSAQLRAGDSAQFNLNGFWIVDEVRLNALEDADLLRLTRQGHLALITAHLLSISNLGLLPPRIKHSAEAAPSTTKKKARVHAKE
jgi:hypothetical protein